MNWKTIFKSLKNRDMQKRIAAVFGIIVVYRLLAHIPIPLTGPESFHELVKNAINSTDLGGFMNLFTGGALTSFSIIMIGISPYITASIITQLITKIVPSIEELSNDGETGRRKINQWTRIIALPLAILQSVAYILILRQTVAAGATITLSAMTTMEWAVAISAMSAGAMLLMWLGELATEQGVGNGISTVIFVGIVSQFPTMLATLISGVTNTAGGGLNVFGWFTLPVNPAGLAMASMLAVIGLLILYLLVKINEAQRLIIINYAKRVQGNSSYGGIRSILPFRLIAAGVIPVIFAVAFLALPAFVGQIFRNHANPGVQNLANNLTTWFKAPTALTLSSGDWKAWIYPVVYFALIVMFTYFYSSVISNSKEIAENLQKQGGFITGVRPGKQTEKYLSSIVSRLNLFGSLSLGFIALTPFIIDLVLYRLFGVANLNLAIGGTGSLIIVTVALENLRQIGSRALMVTYDEYQ